MTPQVPAGAAGRQKYPALIDALAAALAVSKDDIGNIVILADTPEGTRLLHTLRDAATAMEALRSLTTRVAHDLTGREN